MRDGQRVYPINKLIMHHAVSDLMINWDDLAVQDWFSSVGKARGYNNGAIWPNHEHPGRPGQPTYAMAHWCLHRYTADGNKYGWRMTELIKDSWNNVAWHAGNWPVNQQSVGVEVAGNYVAEDLDLKAFMLVADWFRGHDQAIGGALEVYGHRTFFATACPGNIFNKIDVLIDMINDPAKWNNILWPPAPAPVITVKDVTTKTAIAFMSEMVDDNAIPAGQTQLRQAGKAGEKTVVTRVTFRDGVEIQSEQISVTVVDPVNEITARGTYVEPPKVEDPRPPIDEPQPADPLPKPTPPQSPKNTLWNRIVLAIINFILARQGKKK